MILRAITLLSSILLTATAQACPDTCVCYQRSVQCSNSNQLDKIPEISADTTKLDLQYQFSNPTLTRQNFSRFTALEELRLKGCSIQNIEPDTFADLENLKLLDLSTNNIGRISPGAFNGLSLTYLFLGYNINLQISDNSFQGLTTEVISFERCGLSSVNESIFTPLRSQMRKLYLNGNKIKRFNSSLRSIFSTLESLRLYDNPLICDCEARWLKEFYDSVSGTTIIRDSDQGSSEEPRCSSPTSLTGEFVNRLEISDFICETPRVEARLTFENNQGTLKCQATGKPAPSITWHKPNGIIEKSSPVETSLTTIGTITIRSNDPDAAGSYRCVASNEAGNVSVTINADWPFDSERITERPCTPAQSNEVIITNSPTTQSAEQEQIFKRKYFTLVDLICAVLGTFVSTLVVCVVILHFCVYKRKGAAYNSPSNSEYSTSSLTGNVCGAARNSMLQQSHPTHHIQSRPLPRIYNQDANPYASTEVPENDFHVYHHGHQNKLMTVTPPCEACMSNGSTFT